MLERHIRLGSLTARFLLPDERYGHDVAYIFGTSLQASDWKPQGEVGAEFSFVEGPAEGARPEIPPDGMVLVHDPLRPELHTEALSAWVERREGRASVRIQVVRLDLPHFDLCVHLAVLFHKLLFLLDRVVLHGAAIRLGEKVCVFLGDKGAGKSTIALKLARSGGTVLGEDHLILRRTRTGTGFVVSGCDERSRLTRKTEEFFFDEPLDAVPADFAGTMKKEVPAAVLFRSSPYIDVPAHYVFFPSVGDRFLPERLSAKAMLLELMKATGKLQRFVDPLDRTRFLDFLASFVPSVAGYRLELSPDLGALEDLVSFLGSLPDSNARPEVDALA